MSLATPMIDERDVVEVLRIVRDMKGDQCLFDMHAHPFEIIWNKVDYRHDAYDAGDDAATNGDLPILTAISTGIPAPHVAMVDQRIFEKAMLLRIRRLYCRVGPRVFCDHMRVSGIDKTLLLPVPSRLGRFDEQMVALARFYKGGQGFLLGGSVPNDVPDEQILPYLDEAVGSLEIKAVKLHPCITGVDPASRSGTDRIERILWACGELGVPLIIHGGGSSGLWNPETARYGSIGRFRDIDWRISRCTVVLAHAGCHSCGPTEVERDVLPILKTMLSRYDNLMVDLSGLQYGIIRQVLDAIETDRIVFGSDALYEPQWSAVVKLFHALGRRAKDPERDFLKIAGWNPRTVLFGRTTTTA